MKKKRKIYVGLIFILGLTVGTGVHLANVKTKIIDKEKNLEKIYSLNNKNLEKTIEKLMNLSNVKEEYMEELKELYLKLIQKEYLEGKGEELLENAFNIVYKSNPSIKSLLFLDIQDKISENREVFFENKKELDNKILDYNYYIDKHNIASTIYNRNRIKEENKDKNI